MGKASHLFVILIALVASLAGLAGPVATPAWLCTEQRTARVRRKRVIVYMRSTADDTEETDQARVQGSAEMCARRGYEPVAFVRELPGETRGLEDALRMVRCGEADRIVMESGAMLPDVFESDTGGLSTRRLADIFADITTRRDDARHRRTRPMPRGGEGA